MRIENPPVIPVSSTSGSYTGNDTVNRAIPHGLGKVPKYVYIVSPGTTFFHLVAGVASMSAVYIGGAVTASTPTVTAMDATNFYVGKATSYPLSANDQYAPAYNWVAFA